MYNGDKGSDTMLSKAYIVPHPPIILPEIGRGQGRVIQNTVNAYRMIAHHIASAKPQSIVCFLRMPQAIGTIFRYPMAHRRLAALRPSV